MRKHTVVARIMPVVLLAATALLVSHAPAFGAPKSANSQCRTYDECFAVGVAAYIYGYPLVIVDKTRQVTTNVRQASDEGAPVNQFAHYPLPNAATSQIVLPSVNTPYSNAFLDLKKEPIILGLPDLAGRFFLIEVMDGWSNVGGEDDSCLDGQPGFCGLGSRYGTQQGDYAFVGPAWTGTLPPGIKQIIRMPTNTAWLAGRVLTTGSVDDIAEVDALRNQFTLTPLGKYGKRYVPPAHFPVDPRINMATPPFQQVDAMDADTFFETLAKLMRHDRPLPEDYTPGGGIVAVIAKMALVPGKSFNMNRLNPVARQAIEAGYEQGKEIVLEQSQRLNLTSTNWSMSLDLGTYGRRYLERAAVARGGLGANLYKDAVYAGALMDNEGNPLNGAHRYVIHFGADQLPPANPDAFWSVTLYNAGLENLFDNTIGRNALGIPAVQGHEVCPSADGSLTLYVQNDAPTDDTEYCNWLPAPAEGFLLLLRMYWPGDVLFDNDNPWIPPAVTRVD
jgi:hypothetical protein